MKKIISVIILFITTQNVISQTALELNSEGIEFAKKGQIDKAFLIFEEAIKLYPDSPGPYTNRGHIYRMRKQYDLAIKDYSKSLELYPHLDVFSARANAYMDTGNFEMAIIDYNEIIEKAPSYPDVYFDRAYANIRLKNFEGAKNDLESQLEIKPNDFKSLGNLINVKKKLKLYDDALADYEKLLEQFTSQEDMHIIYNNRATLYRDMDNYKEALVDVNESLRIKENYDIGLFNRAGIYLKLGDEKKACKDFKKALKLDLEKNDHFEAGKDFEALKKLCK